MQWFKIADNDEKKIFLKCNNMNILQILGMYSVLESSMSYLENKKK